VDCPVIVDATSAKVRKAMVIRGMARDGGGLSGRTVEGGNCSSYRSRGQYVGNCGDKTEKKIVIDKKGENHLTLFHRPGTRIKTSRNQHFPNATVLVFTFPFFLIGVKSDRSIKKTK